MGRGRQKAKQTKVARELKYFTPATDYRALEKELTSGKTGLESASGKQDVEDHADVGDADEYGAWYDDEG
jgi:hypothetical protein